MNLERVTITGADSGTSISALIELSEKYPFVEWGILASRSQQGRSRFPGLGWTEAFSIAAPKHKMMVSTHICGSWVRELLVGDLDWKELPPVVSAGNRIQINTHGQRHESTVGMMESLAVFGDKEFIFQWDGVNDHLPFAARNYGFNVSALFDTSAGAGILPKSWTRSTAPFWCGYAGGLGPDNVVEQIRNIEQVCDRRFWIDMEGRVRTDDDHTLDLKRVELVLEFVKRHVLETADAKA
ncbi:MAG: hypothetical protein ACRDQZ_09240 [Mycobacteriales bacterium]